MHTSRKARVRGVELGLPAMLVTSLAGAATAEGATDLFADSAVAAPTEAAPAPPAPFTSDTDFSPFVGGGFELITVEVDDGLGTFGEIDVERMRLRGSRFVASVRVEAPFFALEGERPSNSLGGPPELVSRYDVPVTLGVGHAW